MPQMMPFFWLLSEIVICLALVTFICSNSQFFLPFFMKKSEFVQLSESEILWLKK